MRAEGNTSKFSDVLDAGESSEADIQEDIEFALIQMKAETLNKINEALARLVAGTYGRCFECGEEISEARLRALPGRERANPLQPAVLLVHEDRRPGVGAGGIDARTMGTVGPIGDVLESEGDLQGFRAFLFTVARRRVADHRRRRRPVQQVFAVPRAGDASWYQEQLETGLAVVTGYDRVSVQPNAGSQGELAGLLAIRAYHRANGQAARDVCLIPSSAHGTNPASAQMCGMKVVVVKSAPNGDIDLEDFADKAAKDANVAQRRTRFEQALRSELAGDPVDIRVDLSVGAGRAVAYGCDLTHGYIDENAAYYSS